MKTLFPFLGYSLQTGDCHRELPRGLEYNSMTFGKGSLSYEEAVFLFGLVVGMKPRVVVETGVETGASTLHLAAALEHQNYGKLYAIEKDPRSVHEVQRLVETLGYQTRVQLLLGESEDFLADPAFYQAVASPVDLAFLDTSIPRRVTELDLILPHMRPGGLVVLHDTNPLHPMGDMQVEHELEDLRTGLRFIHMNSPRRMTLVQKEL